MVVPELCDLRLCERESNALVMFSYLLEKLSMTWPRSQGHRV